MHACIYVSFWSLYSFIYLKSFVTVKMNPSNAPAVAPVVQKRPHDKTNNQQKKKKKAEENTTHLNDANGDVAGDIGDDVVGDNNGMTLPQMVLIIIMAMTLQVMQVKMEIMAKSIIHWTNLSIILKK